MREFDQGQGTERHCLRQLEFGDKFDAVIRLVSVTVAGVLVYYYTGWISALIWPVYFDFAWAIHAVFAYTRRSISSKGEIALAGLLFGNMQSAFGWFPLVLFVNESRELMLVGAALLTAQLLFLVRRNDTLWIYHAVQISIVILGTVLVYIAFLPILETPLTMIGAAVALIWLNYHFIQSIRVARQMGNARTAAVQQAHQAVKLAAIGQLAGGVAHDFNNNLMAMIGSMEMLRTTRSAAEREEIIDNALVAADQAARTVEQLMIFARSEKPAISELQTCEVFGELFRLTERLIPTSIKLEISSNHQSLPILANRNQLLSGLVNIVTNSVYAMPKGGALTLESRLVQVDAADPTATSAHLEHGAYVRITLEDSGHGIPDSLLAKVVDPFFTTKPIGKGTGLGLSVVYGMMQELKGGMSITSSAQGTKVSLFFPHLDTA